MNIKIYTLVDPNDNCIRYVGKTITELNKRLGCHIRDSKRGEMTHKCTWIRKLIQNQQRPIINLIEENISEDEWCERERYYIQYYKDAGYDLTNSTSGGEGMHGYKPNAETRKKISNSNKGRKHSEEVKRYLSLIKTGRKLSEETKDRISVSKKGTKLSEAHKEKLKKRFSGAKNAFYGKKHDDNTRKIMSEKAKSRTPSHVRAVRQINLQTNEVIKIWPSMTAAGKELQISYKCIHKVCNKKMTKYKNYGWEYI